MVEKICKNCNKNKKNVSLSGISEGLCKECYRKLIWKPKIVKCKRCNRDKPMHAKGLCIGCYNSVFHIDKVKADNWKKLYGIDSTVYLEITKSCVLCGFDKVVDLHHLDHDHSNISRENLVGLCPNHHKMLHHRNYKKEIYSQLEEKGFKVPNLYEDDSVFKQN